MVRRLWAMERDSRLPNLVVLLQTVQWAIPSDIIRAVNFLQLINDVGFAGAISFLLFVVIALSVHEFAHAWTANRYGDDTPRLMGRLTLDPRSHVDPIGGLLFLLIGFGWGRPVIINPLRLKSRAAELFVALAGPASNILLALILATIIVLFALLPASSFITNLNEMLKVGIHVNILLAAFNFLPIPPLDGSTIIAFFWPPYRSLFASQMGFLLLIALLFLPLGRQLFSAIITPLYSYFHDFVYLPAYIAALFS